MPSIFDPTGAPQNRAGKTNVSLMAAMKSTARGTVDAIIQVPIEKLDEMPDNEAVFGYKDEDIKAIADEIKRNGFRGSIEVVRNKEQLGRYTIVSGHQRKRALELNGAKEVPCHVLKDMDELQIRDYWRSENVLHRKQTPYRLALLVKSYDDDYVNFKQKGGKDNYVSERLHVGVTQVKRYRQILSFPEDVAIRCDSTDFPYTTLLSAKGFSSKQNEMLSAALKQRDIDSPNLTLTSEELKKIIAKVEEDSKESEFGDQNHEEEYEVHTGEDPKDAQNFVKTQRESYRVYYDEMMSDVDDTRMDVIDTSMQKLVDNAYTLLNGGHFMVGNRVTVNKTIYGLERLIKILKEKGGY